MLFPLALLCISLHVGLLSKESGIEMDTWMGFESIISLLYVIPHCGYNEGVTNRLLSSSRSSIYYQEVSFTRWTTINTAY